MKSNWNLRSVVYLFYVSCLQFHSSRLLGPFFLSSTIHPFAVQNFSFLLVHKPSSFFLRSWLIFGFYYYKDVTSPRLETRLTYCWPPRVWYSSWTIADRIYSWWCYCCCCSTTHYCWLPLSFFVKVVMRRGPPVALFPPMAPFLIRNSPCWRILPAEVGLVIYLNVLQDGQIFLKAGR